MIQKIKTGLPIQDAMDNLAAIANIDMASPPPLGIVKKTRIVTDEDELGIHDVQWLSGEGAAPILDVLDETYRGIHYHLMSLYENPEMNWENEKSRKGVAAMMSLVGESASKIENYLIFRLGKAFTEKVEERPEYKALQQYYSQIFALKFEGGVEGEAAWTREWDENEAAPLLDMSNTGLQSFETVKRDKEYELFYIHNEEGKPYFNSELLRNIRLSCDFDLVNESFEEDPLLKIRTMQDRDLHASALQILGECHPAIVDFYKIYKKVSDNDLATSLSMALVALFIAANPRYLIQNTTGKSCLEYFEDFHRFIRRSMKAPEYQKMIAYPPDASDKNGHILLYLTHSLCRSFFERIGGVKQEAIGLIHRAMRQGEEIIQKKEQQLQTGDTVWNQFLLDDEKFRTLLDKFPDGPLFKILDLVREKQASGTIIPFDPFAQENLPSRLYEIRSKGKRIDLLRIPSPTKQSLINKCEVIDEFRGFLRALGAEKLKRKHLLVNLQDRTSWKEYARSRSLEVMQSNAEYSSQLVVIALPKDTDFYYQIEEYFNLNQADEFLQVLKQQVRAGEECGFFFPAQLKIQEVHQFVDDVIPLIHEFFFQNKKTLSRRNREDFIEIFYQFLILKCIDLLNPDSISFTCKDAIDTGAAETGTFYGFIKLINGNFSEKEEQDFLRWLLYTPALFIRERATDPERLHRTLATLERFDTAMAEQGKDIVRVFGNLYHPQTLKTLEVKHL